MLRALLISPNAQLRRELEMLLETSEQVYLLESLDQYPAPHQMDNLLTTYGPQVIFMDVFSSMDGLQVAARANQSGLFLVALHRFRDQYLMTELMRSGIREYLYSPFTQEQLSAALERIQGAFPATGDGMGPSCQLHAFLPAKAGAGASTIAVQTALALERIPGTRPLLADFDLWAGASKFLLRLKDGFSVHEALDRAGELDEALWSELIARVGTLHILASSGARPRFRFEPTHTRFVMDFCRRHYKNICLDFSGNLDEQTIEILNQCRQIFLVVTQEMTPVHMAREKLTLLEAQGLHDRISLVVNRWRHKAPLSLSDVEQALGLHAEHVFTSNEAAVNRAVLNGGSVEPSTNLGKEFARFSEMLSETTTALPEKSGWRFLEFFTTLPARYANPIG